MNSELKITKIVLFIAQWVTMICGISAGVYWWKFGGWIVLALTIFFVYMSMNFYGLKIHLGRLISEDFTNQTQKSLKIWTGLNRRQRRKAAPIIKKELIKSKK